MSTPISIHQRTYETEAFDEGDGTMRIVGRLVDTKPIGLGIADGEPIVIHDMTVEMIVAYDGFEIRDVHPVMNVKPFSQCTGILDRYRQLVGHSIARGYSRRVRELFGGPNGCSHVGALLIALGPVAIQASWGVNTLHDNLEDFEQGPYDPAQVDRQLRLNENTCHVWKSGGSQIEFLRRGERPERPGWMTERLVQLGIDPEPAVSSQPSHRR